MSNQSARQNEHRMSGSTSIEWTDAVWNPTTGCDRVSPGCDNCYALRMAGRLKAMKVAKYQQDGNPRTSGPGFGLTLHPDVINTPRKWRKPRMVFVDSMSDLFHSGVPDSFIEETFEVMEDCSQHTFQVLTKRSRRLSVLADRLRWPPNVWMGVSVENNRYAFRVDHLREVPSKVRFVSAEPLLGSVNELNLEGIHWVIAGGESGPGYRQVEKEWVRSLRDACIAAEVKFFFKQWGGRTPKAGGRSLDGRIWGEMPPDVGFPAAALR